MTKTTETVERTISPAEIDPVCTAVVAAVADAKGTDPVELDQRLSDVVDPDALERIFGDPISGGSRTNGHVKFTMAGSEVTVSAAGTVTVVPPTPQQVSVDSDLAVACGSDDRAASDG